MELLIKDYLREDMPIVLIFGARYIAISCFIERFYEILSASAAILKVHFK